MADRVQAIGAIDVLVCAASRLDPEFFRLRSVGTHTAASTALRDFVRELTDRPGTG